MSIEKYIADVIAREGGYVNHPDDAGGPTKFGITLKTLADWRSHEVDASDVEALGVDEAYQIYKQNYLIGPGINNISDDKLKALMFDTAVHCGAVRAVKFLQEAIGARQDGVIGPVTIQLINNMIPLVVRVKYLSLRIRYNGAIISADPTQAVFAKGWSNRVGDLLEKLI